MTFLSSRRNCRNQAFTLVELLVVIAIIGILVALLLPAIQAAREAARRAQCQSNAHNVALAVLNYESARKVLPNGMTFGTAFESAGINTMNKFGPNWIIEILPYMEEQGLRDSFDPSLFLPPDSAGFRPVNDNPSIAANVKARGSTIPSLLCPSDPFNRVLYQGGASGGANHGGNWARTNYAASAGRAFIYPSNMTGPNSVGWKDNCKRGVMGPNVAVKLKRIADGTSKTIMIGEIRAGITENDARGVWAMGHAGASLIAHYGALGDANGPNAAYANSDDAYSDVADAPGICGPRTNATAAAENMSVHSGGFDEATTRSKHPGGVHVAMADGSVQFVNDDVETTGCYQECCSVWDYMIASADGAKPGPLNGAGLSNACH